MKIQKSEWALSAILILTVFAVLAVAAGEQNITLKADKAGKGAKGQVVITDKGADQKEITITATGLKPDSVYTVWLVNMKPKMGMIGLGTGDYSFKSDNRGIGQYSTNVPAAELDKWQMVEVAYHPDGNPKNMKKMGIALKAPVKTGKE